MLSQRTSARSVDEVAAALPAAAARHGFGVLGGYDFRKKLAEKGVAIERDVRVFDVCHPVRAKQALESDARVSAILPCRIAVYREGGETKLAALDPAYLAGMFGSPGLQAVGDQVAPVLAAILDEAAGA